MDLTSLPAYNRQNAMKKNLNKVHGSHIMSRKTSTAMMIAIGLTLGSSCGAVWAQPAGTYVSGLLHEPVGGATFVSMTDRSLVVGNLGSSGNDGVEVYLDTVWGGGVSVDIAPLLGAAGVAREIKIRPKGWDGTINGQVRLLGSPDGVLTEEYDFSDSGALAMRWRLLGAVG